MGPLTDTVASVEKRLADRRASAYLERLEVEARPGEVDAATLATLQRAHVARIPYENLDIFRGKPPGIEPLDCVERLLGGRGGYCYHLNGAFVALLEWLQVDVTRHVSGVQGSPLVEAPGPNANHLGITVRTAEGTEWFVDVGLGDGPGEPLPLAWGRYEREGFAYELRPSRFDRAGWRFEHDPRGLFVGVDCMRAAATTGDFEAMHHDRSTSPQSRFVQVVVILRRIAGGIETLRGCVQTTITAAATESVEVSSEQDWWELVIDRFGLAYGDLPAAERARVWRRVRDIHEARAAAGG